MEKRSITLAGHRTSVALEPEFWAHLERIARERLLSLPALIQRIDRSATDPAERTNLASRLRLAVVADLERARLSPLADRAAEAADRP